MRTSIKRIKDWISHGKFLLSSSDSFDSSLSLVGRCGLLNHCIFITQHSDFDRETLTIEIQWGLSRGISQSQIKITLQECGEVLQVPPFLRVYVITKIPGSCQ